MIASGFQNSVLVLAVAVAGGELLSTASSTVIMSRSQPPISATWEAPAEVVAGSDVIVTWHITKLTACNGTNQRSWEGVDGFVLNEPLGQTTLPASPDVQTYKIQTAIPDLAPVGPLSLRIIGSYKCPSQAEERFNLGPVQMEVVE